MTQIGKCSNQRFISVTLFALAVGMAVLVFLHFNPGALSPDSLSILAQARSGIFEDGHPPLMAAIWRIVDQVVPGSIGMLLLNLGLFYGGLYLTFRWAALRYQFGVLPAFLVVGLFPPIIGILGAIWIDVTMAGFFLSSFGTFLAGCDRPEKSLRIGALLGGIFFTSLGIATRHNGAAAAFPILVFFFLIYMQTWSRPLPRFLFAIFGGAFVTLLLFIGTKIVLSYAVDVHRHFWRVAAVYDIVGTSYNKNQYLFYPDLRQDDSLDNVRKLYSPRSLTPLLLGQQIHALPGQTMEIGKPFDLNHMSPDLNQRLFLNWMDVIIHHPIAYLKHRYDVFKSLVTRSPWGLWAPVYDIILPNDLGIAARSRADSGYYKFIKYLSYHGPLFVPLPYLILSSFALILTLIFGLWSNNFVLIVAATLYGSGLAHMFGLFFIVGSSDFRYSHWMITTTTLATSLLCLEILQGGGPQKLDNVLR